VLEFKILGPLEVLRDGRSVPLAAAKQRALVADLLVHVNEVASTDRLIEDLWGEAPPAGADHNIQQYVSRLRKAFEEDGPRVLVTRTPGYAIELGPEDVLDADRFERAVGQARRGATDPAETLALLEGALALWRGPALADFAYEPFAEAAARRLEELRAVAEEERIGALLAMGRHRDAIPELDSLVLRYPLREHLRAQQMLALYRSGRQADALAASQAARRALAAELGVDPGPEIRDLEEAILRHDPKLAAPDPAAARRSETPVATTPDAAAMAPTRRRGRVAIVAAVVLLVAGFAIAVASFAGDDPSSQADTSPSGTGSDTTTGSETGPAPGGSLDLSWQEDPAAEVFTGPGNELVLGGAETPIGHLAFGYSAPLPTDEEPRPDFDAAVWHRPPGGAWSRVEADSFAAPGNQRVTDVAVLEERDLIVMIGWDESRGDFDGAVWVYELGDPDASWERVDETHPSLQTPGDQRMREVTVLDDRLVAVGWQVDSDGRDVASAWTSRNGRRWAASRPLPAEGDEEMATVTSDGTMAVAGGWSAGESDRDAEVWTTRDGIDWRPVRDAEVLGGPGDQQINSVAATDDGFAAVGEERIGDDTNAVVWTSPDGRNWERVPESSDVFGGEGDQTMSVVTTSPLGLVAAGSEALGHDVNGAVWTSPDGLTWVRLPGDTPAMSPLTDPSGRQDVRVLIPTETGFLALGAERRGRDLDADAWIGTATT
jgi:DNA-binding SARP family transcriptional activator